MQRRDTFETVAPQYHRYRPGYPDAAFDEITSRFEPGSRRRALEIGPGTGQATAALVARGFSVVAVELGRNLAALLSERFAGQPVTVVRADFEDFSTTERFRLVLAAQSFHHLALDAGLRNAAEVLSPDGLLALLWNQPVPSDSELLRAIDGAYRQWAPTLRGRRRGERALEEAILAAPEFESMEVKRYRWTRSYPRNEYLGLLGTHSDHVLLPAETRDGLFRAIGDAIRDHGGELTLERETYLLLARRSDRRP
jgi:SAM-dependent methyltransferase